MWELRPPYGSIVFGDDDVQVDLTRRGIKSRKGILVASEPLAGGPGVVTPRGSACCPVSWCASVRARS